MVSLKCLNKAPFVVLAIILLALMSATAVGAAAPGTVRAIDVTAVPGGTYMLVINADGTVSLVPLVLIKPGVQPPPPPPPPGTLAEKVKAWTSAIGDPETAAKVAVGYRTVASQIRAGRFTTKQQVVDVQKQVNAVMYSSSAKKAAWVDFEGKLAAELDVMQKAGQLNDLPAMAVAWDQIAAGIDSAGTAAIDWEKLIQLIVMIIELILKLIGGGAA